MLQKTGFFNLGVESYLEKELKKEVTRNQIIINLLSKRYLHILNLKYLPSPRVFMDYLNPNDSNFSLEKAAISCEFYGGVGVDFLKSRKNPFNLNDYELLLSTVYYNISNFDNSFKYFYEKSPEILFVFRKTTKYLKNSGIESKVLNF